MSRIARDGKIERAFRTASAGHVDAFVKRDAEVMEAWNRKERGRGGARHVVARGGCIFSRNENSMRTHLIKLG